MPDFPPRVIACVGAVVLRGQEVLDEPVDKFCDWLARRVLCGEYRLIPPEPANPYQPHLAFL